MEPEDQAGEYELHEVIGQGGMGTVHRARQVSLDRWVAVKVLHQHEVEDLQRFQREARLLSSLDHPGFVRVLDSGRLEGRPFLAMDLMEVPTLEARLRKGPLGLDQALRTMESLCASMAAAHRAGIVHRDLKSSNVFVGDGGEARISDFGIARRIHAGGTVTRPGFTMGSPAAMAPEQLREERPTPATDQYALALIFCEMVTGELPFPVHDVAAMLEAKVRGTLAMPGLADPRLGPSVQEVLRIALASRPADRFPGVDELAVELVAARERDRHGETRPGRDEAGVIDVTRVARAARSGELDRRAAAGAATALGVLAIVGLVLRSGSDPVPPSPSVTPQIVTTVTPIETRSMRRMIEEVQPLRREALLRTLALVEAQPQGYERTFLTESGGGREKLGLLLENCLLILDRGRQTAETGVAWILLADIFDRVFPAHAGPLREFRRRMTVKTPRSLRDLARAEIQRSRSLERRVRVALAGLDADGGAITRSLPYRYCRDTLHGTLEEHGVHALEEPLVMPAGVSTQRILEGREATLRLLEGLTPEELWEPAVFEHRFERVVGLGHSQDDLSRHFLSSREASEGAGVLRLHARLMGQWLAERDQRPGLAVAPINRWILLLRSAELLFPPVGPVEAREATRLREDLLEMLADLDPPPVVALRGSLERGGPTLGMRARQLLEHLRDVRPGAPGLERLERLAQESSAAP